LRGGEGLAQGKGVDLKAHEVCGGVYPGLRGLKAPLPGAS
jgi:hypothetical protein